MSKTDLASSRWHHNAGDLRIASGISLITLAGRMGSRPNYIHACETGARIPTVAWVLRYNDALTDIRIEKGLAR